MWWSSPRGGSSKSLSTRSSSSLRAKSRYFCTQFIEKMLKTLKNSTCSEGLIKALNFKTSNLWYRKNKSEGIILLEFTMQENMYYPQYLPKLPSNSPIPGLPLTGEEVFCRQTRSADRQAGRSQGSFAFRSRHYFWPTKLNYGGRGQVTKKPLSWQYLPEMKICKEYTGGKSQRLSEDRPPRTICLLSSQSTSFLLAEYTEELDPTNQRGLHEWHHALSQEDLFAFRLYQRCRIRLVCPDRYRKCIRRNRRYRDTISKAERIRD